MAKGKQPRTQASASAEVAGAVDRSSSASTSFSAAKGISVTKGSITLPDGTKARGDQIRAAALGTAESRKHSRSRFNIRLAIAVLLLVSTATVVALMNRGPSTGRSVPLTAEPSSDLVGARDAVDKGQTQSDRSSREGPKRVYLRSTIEEIVKSNEGLNGIQRAALFDATFKDKWLRVELPIWKVDLGILGNPVVTLHKGLREGESVDAADVILVMAWFDVAARSSVSHLQRGVVVTIEGKLHEIEAGKPSMLILDECEVLP